MLSDGADASIIKEMADEGLDVGLEYTRVRPRILDDLAACESLARAVHRHDRYPIALEDDVREFLAPSSQLAAWVAEHCSVVVGHVALHSPTSGAMTTVVCEATGVHPSGVGVVSRLMVARDARGHGLGRRLLTVATDEARRRGLLAALDVVISYAAAIAVYETEGRRIGRISIPMPNGELVDEYVYVLPARRSDE